MSRRPRRPDWRCRFVDPETGIRCLAWGFADPGESAGDLQHQHYLEHHYQPPEDQ